MMGILAKVNVYFLIIIYPLLPIIKETSLILGNIIEGAILLILFFSLIIQKDDIDWKIGVPTKTFIALNVLIIVTLFYLSDCFDSDIYDVFSAVRVLLFYILFIGILRKLLISGQVNIKKLITVIDILLILFSIGAIIQFVNPDLFLLFHNSTTMVDLRSKSDFIAFSIFNRTFSFFNDPNVFGVFSVFGFFICFEEKNKTNKLLSYTAMSGSIVSILLSQSRTAIILFFMFFLLRFMLSITLKRNIKVFQLFFMFFILCGFIYFIFVNLDSIIDYLRVDTLLTGNGRVAGSAAKFDYIINQSPFGLIFGNGMGIARDIIFENSYLLLIYQQGILGFLIFWGTAVFLLGDSLIIFENIPVLICYLGAIYVGDYILIPQITYLVILFFFIMRYSSLQEKGDMKG